MEDYKENLKTYIKEDIIYQEYLKNKNKNFSDFDKFCIQHCKDIEELLEENQKLKAELQLYQGALKREHEAIHRVNDLEERIDEAIELLNNPWSFESGNKEVDEITHKKKWEIINLLKEVK